MIKGEDMAAAYEEGRKAREDNYAKNANPYLESKLRASWNRGWNLLDDWIRREQDQSSEDEWVVQQIRDELEKWSTATTEILDLLKEQTDYLFRSQRKAEGRILEVETRLDDEKRTRAILARELGPSWMDRIEALEKRVGQARLGADRAHERIDANYSNIVDLQERDARLEERIESLISTLHAAEIRLKEAGSKINSLETEDLPDRMRALEEYSARGIRDNGTRIADLETTLERLEGLDAESEETDSYVTAEDCDKMRWPEGLNTEYLNQVPKEVREVAVDAAMKFLDDNVEWVGEPPAAGPWKEGPPPYESDNTWLVQWGNSGNVSVLEDMESEVPITHHARIQPETESED